MRMPLNMGPTKNKPRQQGWEREEGGRHIRVQDMPELTDTSSSSSSSDGEVSNQIEDEVDVEVVGNFLQGGLITDSSSSGSSTDGEVSNVMEHVDVQVVANFLQGGLQGLDVTHSLQASNDDSAQSTRQSQSSNTASSESSTDTTGSRHSDGGQEEVSSIGVGS